MLEDICALARASTPALIEVARTRRGGRIDRTVYAWSTGRIIAVVGAEGVTLERRRGVNCGGSLAVEWRDLESLANVVDDWSARRASWSAFYVSTAGYPAGFGGAAYYQRAGADGVPIVIGRELFGRPREGEWLRGREEVRPIASPECIDAMTEIDAQIWRLGEHHGNASGEIVGCVYTLPTLRAFAYRHHLRVAARDSSEVHIETSETDLPREL